jgi:hypothetical protein
MAECANGGFFQMMCRERIAELVECARRGDTPGFHLGAHLAGCPECAERWTAECELSSYLRMMASRAAKSFDEDRPLAYAHRESLMRDFAWRHRRSPAWVWALSAAAALVFTIGVGHELGSRMKRPPAGGGLKPQAVFYEASADAGALSSDDFIAVPYSPPLATGELVTVVHGDLGPVELAGMGFDVDPASGNLSADVVMGQDGFPRAVRLADGTQF